MPTKHRIIPLTYVFMSLSVFLVMAFVGWKEMWSALFLLNPFEPLIDLRVISKGASLYSAGKTPYGELGSFNYPLIWAFMGQLVGLENSARLPLIASLMVGFYVGANFLFLKRYPSWPLLVFSLCPTFFFAFQICNNDLIIITLVTLGLISENQWVSRGSLFAAGLLKIYPFSAFCTMATNRREFLTQLLLATIAMIALASQLANIRQATPYAVLGYGVVSLSMALDVYTTLHIDPLLIAALLMIGPLIAVPFENPKPPRITSHRKLFFAGATIYLSTFLLIGVNFSIRTAFLMYCIPGILEMKSKVFKTVLITSILAMANFSYLMRNPFGYSIYLIATVVVFEGLAIEVLRSLLLEVRSRMSVDSTVPTMPRSA